LDEIVQEATARNLTQFKSRMNLRTSSVRLHFSDYKGNRYVAGISIARALHLAGKDPHDTTAVYALGDAIDSLVLNVPGLQATRHIRPRMSE
jgi:hypothetical protein